MMTYIKKSVKERGRTDIRVKRILLPLMDPSFQKLGVRPRQGRKMTSIDKALCRRSSAVYQQAVHSSVIL